MKRILTVIAVLLSVNAFAQREGSPALGKATFEKFCSVCHGATGEGTALGKVLTNRESKLKSDTKIMDIITNGVPGTAMSAYNSGLSQDEIFWTMLFVRELQGDRRVRGTELDMAALPPRPVISDEARRGEHLFNGKAGCIECHSYYTRGGFLGPDLSNIARELLQEEIATAVFQPNAAIRVGFGTRQVMLTDGSRLEGRYRYEDENSIQIANDDATLWRTFFKTDISRMREGRNSLMPDDYATRLTDAEQAELLAFLETLK